MKCHIFKFVELSIGFQKCFFGSVVLGKVFSKPTLQTEMSFRCYFLRGYFFEPTKALEDRLKLTFPFFFIYILKLIYSNC